MLGSQGALPAAKQRPWDESIRVPFLLHYPALGALGAKEIKAPINTPDILPTLLGLSGIEKPKTLEGEDLSGVILGRKTLHDRAALFMNISPFAENYVGKEYRGIRTARYTYALDLEGPWLLFDNEKDPYQLNNLVSDPESRATKKWLHKELKKQLSVRKDEFRPRDYYIKKWRYKVDPNNGVIPYGDGPHEAQSPGRID